MGLCIDILFIADTSDEDTPISGKVGNRGRAGGGTTVFPAKEPRRGLKENREGMASSPSFCTGISDVESWSSSLSSNADNSSDWESSPKAGLSERRKLFSSSSLGRFCRLRGASSWRCIRSSVVRARRLLLDGMVGNGERGLRKKRASSVEEEGGLCFFRSWRTHARSSDAETWFFFRSPTGSDSR